MISVLADNHAAQQPGPWQAFGDRLIGDRSDDDLFFAATASILPASMLDYFQNGRHEFQLLARLAADSLSHFTAARAWLFIFVNVVLYNFAWQVFWQPRSEERRV